MLGQATNALFDRLIDGVADGYVDLEDLSRDSLEVDRLSHAGDSTPAGDQNCSRLHARSLTVSAHRSEAHQQSNFRVAVVFGGHEYSTSSLFKPVRRLRVEM